MNAIAAELREQGRGMAGAMLVLGLSFAFTNEAWWLAVEIPDLHLIGYVLGGLALVVPVVRTVGFRDEGSYEETSVWIEFFEIVFQSFVVAIAMLWLLDILDPAAPLSENVRLVLLQIVPLAFGAAVANELLSGEQDEIPEGSFPRSLGAFTMGAVFVSAPIAPTGEVAALATRPDWPRIGLLVLITLGASYMILFGLEFRGQEGRLKGSSLPWLLGHTVVLYAIGLVVAGGLLLAVGDTGSEPFSTGLRRTIVLAFPAAIGASAARVVVG